MAKRKSSKPIVKVHAPDQKEQLHQEIVALRKEVKELRGVVNMLMEMVMEHGEPEEIEMDYGDFRMDRNSRPPMGM